MVPHVAGAVTGQRPPGSTPLATLEQLPTVPARLHARQAAVQALLQQTPCAQKVLAHSVPAEQVAPFGFKPQELEAAIERELAAR